MKTLKNVFWGLAACSILIFTGCEDETDPVAPTITFTSGAGYTSADATVSTGDSIKFQVVCAGEKLSSFTSSYAYDGGNAVTWETTEPGNAADYTYDKIAVMRTTPGTEKYTFKVDDANGESKESSITLTVEQSGTVLGTVNTGSLHHQVGANGCTGAWDFNSDIAQTSSDPSNGKDMLNTDQPGAAFTGGWSSGNFNSTFAKATSSYSYASGTLEQAIAEYNSVGGSQIVIGPAADDVYIAKISRSGQSDFYTVIKVLTIDANDVTCNAATQNKGKMTFEYKKQ